MKKQWKHITIGMLSFIACFSAYSAPKPMDEMAVIVNDGTILDSDIDTSLKLLKANMKKQDHTLPSDDILRKQVINQLILDKLQQQEAKRIGVNVDDTRLNQALTQIAKQNHQTLSQLRQTIENVGVSFAAFRERIRGEIAASDARNALVRRRINILPEEVNSMASQLAQQDNQSVEYHISHIQLKTDDSADSDANTQKLAKTIIQKLKNGADFKTLALTYSKGPNALKGGDWGWMRKEEMPTIFADHIELPSKGAIIGPFKSGVGYHILKIDDVKGLKTVSVTEVNARHILIKTSVIMSDDGARKELEGIIKQIRSGQSTFAKLAEQYSQDPGSASQGGNLGFQSPDVYVPEFKHQVETLPVGQISQPFKTVNGWHIVEVLGRRKVDRTDAALKNKAYQLLFNRKFNEEASAWIQELKASAFIEVLGNK